MWPDGSSADVAELRKRLLRRARRYATDAHAAEDLAQEALLRVWTRAQSDPPITDIERYLFVTLRHLSARRAEPTEEPIETHPPTVDAMAADRLAAQAVIAALQRLPDAQARLIWEHAVEGASYVALAKRYDLPVGTVMSRVARGRTRLCQRLGIPRAHPVRALLDAAE
ncbi:MAG: sigma-70 family RNA polymerase sigma factor [Pseudomonadota bacterium]